jgi:diguanylate cyclase (GGDEF)-like protein
MNAKKNRDSRLTPSRIAIAVFGTGASLAGSLSTLSGSVAVPAVVALAIGGGTVAWFLFFKKTEITLSVPVAQAEVLRGVPPVIPPDRIDELTGLANENGLFAWFSENGAKLAADGKGIVVLSADLADFGTVEKTRGKAISDAVLIEVSKRVASCAGEGGIAARTSGDEFAAVATVVPSHSAEVAAEQAGKLAELLQRPVELPTGVIWIGGSVGVAWGSPLAGEAVLGRAREALKKAVKLGRGHYVVATIEKQE